MNKYHCKICKKSASEISEYVCEAKKNKMDVDDYIEEEEGTLNFKTKQFYCTNCYVKIGMPIGIA